MQKEVLDTDLLNSITERATDSTGATTEHSPIGLFVENVLQLNNGALNQMADYLEKQPTQVRMRFIERYANLVSSVADLHC